MKLKRIIEHLIKSQSNAYNNLGPFSYKIIKNKKISSSIKIYKHYKKSPHFRIMSKEIKDEIREDN